jgi:hypothetical protein
MRTGELSLATAWSRSRASRKLGVRITGPTDGESGTLTVEPLVVRDTLLPSKPVAVAEDNEPIVTVRSARIERLVPVEGIEPPLLAEHDFESCASTSSATRASRAVL